jgi:hypothetical protein
MAETPELDRQHAVIKSGRSEAVQDFIDWLAGNGYVIMKRCTDPIHEGRYNVYCGACQDTGVSGAVYDYPQLMADHFGIDRDKIETERRALLEELRADD